MSFDFGVWSAFSTGFTCMVTLVALLTLRRTAQEPASFWRTGALALSVVWPWCGPRVLLGVLRSANAMLPMLVGISFFAVTANVTGDEPEWFRLLGKAMAWETLLAMVFAVFVGATGRPRFVVPHFLRDREQALQVIAEGCARRK